MFYFKMTTKENINKGGAYKQQQQQQKQKSNTPTYPSVNNLAFGIFWSELNNNFICELWAEALTSAAAVWWSSSEEFKTKLWGKTSNTSHFLWTWRRFLWLHRQSWQLMNTTSDEVVFGFAALLCNPTRTRASFGFDFHLPRFFIFFV